MTSTDHRRTIDFCDAAFYDDPWEDYRWLRENAPLYRDETNDLWVVSSYKDVFDISRAPELYSSASGVRPKLAAPLSLIGLDDPEHTRQRRLINRGFTPRRVAELVPHIRELSNQLIDEIAGRGEIDFVEDMAIHVPLIVIAELMGLDPQTRLKMYRWSDAMMAGDGHSDPDDPVLARAGEAFLEFNAMCADLITARRLEPLDDLTSVLAQHFDEHELNMFLAVLLIAGNETTRNAITGGLLALSLFPAERERLIEHLDDEEFVELAVNELIRWVSPVISFSRTVTRDHAYRGEQLREGDRILMLYQSANRDAEVFSRPDDVILDRDPNPHLAFGIGTHYCLGANLARLEVKTVFQELFRRLPDITVAEGARRSRGQSSLVIAIQHLPAVFTPV